MSILAQYNTLQFYETKAQRTWNKLIANGGNEELFRFFFETDKIPAVQLIVDSATTATIELLDSNDEVVGSPLSMTVEDATTYKRLIYLGTTLSGNSDGDYSLKITNGANTYYSDVFGWTSSTDYLGELLKISATSSNIRLSKAYTANLSSFTFEGYINAEYLGLQPEVDEKTVQKYGAVNVLYSNLVPTRQFEVYGNEYLFRFLLGLRVLETNGSITLTWDSIDYSATDIQAEITEEHLKGYIYQISLSFVQLSDIVSTINDSN